MAISGRNAEELGETLIVQALEHELFFLLWRFFS